MLRQSIFLFAMAGSLIGHGFAFGETDPCSTFADLQSQDTQNFIGYGTGATEKAAEQASREDLASRIRSQISSTSTVSADNHNTSFTSESKSVVSEVLFDAQILKRCKNKQSFSVVTKVTKSSFFSSLEKKILVTLTKATQLNNSLNDRVADDSLGEQVEAAKRFLATYDTSAEDDLHLCQTYNRCKDINIQQEFQALREKVTKFGEKDQYLLVTDDQNPSAKLRDELTDLLTLDNVHVMDGALLTGDEVSSFSRRILATCKTKMGSNIPNTQDRVFEVRCTADGYAGKQKKFHKIYECSSIIASSATADEALDSCAGRLQPQDTKKP